MQTFFSELSLGALGFIIEKANQTAKA